MELLLSMENYVISLAQLVSKSDFDSKLSNLPEIINIKYQLFMFWPFL